MIFQRDHPGHCRHFSCPCGRCGDTEGQSGNRTLQRAAQPRRPPESAWVSVVEVGGSRLGNAGATTEMLFDKPNIRGSLTKSPGASHPVNIAPLPLRREPHEIRCHGPLRHGHPFAGPRPRRTRVRRGGGIRHPRDGFKSTARLLSRACRITAASFLVTLYSVSL